MRQVSFRYSETEDFVLENVNFAIGPGEAATIMGPSGGGKTTLMKIMLGLLQPTSGEVLIDGLPLTTLGARPYRDQVAAVMQDDQLLSGSIADNICFFDRVRSRAVDACARLAGIHDEIMAMPMAYNSLVGDMGNSLSGGQKQRVLLARALYREPGSSSSTKAPPISTWIRSGTSTRVSRLSMTRVSVAHRPAISAGADRLILLAKTIQSERPGPTRSAEITDRISEQRAIESVG